MELQLKGAGRTPFCRTGDGRAVLRSSVREFLASEAMHHLGVPTTRALSLVVSRRETVRRPWYREDNPLQPQQQRHGGDVLQEEATAITTRGAPSFLRVGHFELYSRRAQTERESESRNGVNRNEEEELGFRMQELAMLAQHAFSRMESDAPPPAPTAPSPLLPSVEQLVWLGHEVARRFAHTSAQWIRVGFAQSNYNSDNCHFEGLTLDYGPFGFMERFEKDWSMWVGSRGGPYGFLNQQVAAGKNLDALLQSLLPLADAVEEQETKQAKKAPTTLTRGGGGGRKRIMDTSRAYSDHYAKEALSTVFAAKLGLWPLPEGPGASLYEYLGHVNATPLADEGRAPQEVRGQAMQLWSELQPLLEDAPVDWTIFWRQLSEVAQRMPSNSSNDHERRPGGAVPRPLLELLFEAFLGEEDRVSPLPLRSHDWQLWLTKWVALSPDGDAMKRANPRYIPREWMLVKAYQEGKEAVEAEARGTSTSQGFSEIHRLQELFRHPYDDDDGKGGEWRQYYRAAPVQLEAQGGVGFMS